MVFFDLIGHYRHFMIRTTCTSLPQPPIKERGTRGVWKRVFYHTNWKINITSSHFFWPKNPFLRWNILGEPADGGLANKFLIDSLQITSLNINSLKINGLETAKPEIISLKRISLEITSIDQKTNKNVYNSNSDI